MLLLTRCLVKSAHQHIETSVEVRKHNCLPSGLKQFVAFANHLFERHGNFCMTIILLKKLLEI